MGKQALALCPVGMQKKGQYKALNKDCVKVVEARGKAEEKKYSDL